MKKRTILKLAILILMCTLFLTGCTEGCNRTQKDLASNWGGGLERTVYVYDLSNTVCMRAYHGKFDVETDNESYLLFDINGKRHIIYYSTANIYIDEETIAEMQERIPKIESQQEIKIDVIS